MEVVHALEVQEFGHTLKELRLAMSSMKIK